MFDKSIMSNALKPPITKERYLKTDTLNVLLVYEMNYIIWSVISLITCTVTSAVHARF